MLRGALVVLLGFAVGEEGVLRSPGLEVRYPDGEREAAEEIARVFFEETPRLAEALSLPEPNGIVVTLVRGAEAFAEALEGRDKPHAAAVAFPFERRVVVRLDRAERRHRTPRAVVRHEVVHLVLGGLGTDVYSRIPRWFHEGLAQRFAGPLFQGDRGTLVRNARAGSLPPLATLEAHFPDATPEVEIAYYLSEAAVREVVGHGGTDRLPRLWECLRSASSFEACFRGVFGLAISKVEAQISQQLVSDKSHLIAVILRWSGVAALVAATPLVLVAWWRRRVAAIRRMEALERAESPEKSEYDKP